MWTAANRSRYDRKGLRYPSDMTDDEWSYAAPLIPPAKHGGRQREVEVREVLNGIMYVLSTGCQWAYLPKDLPPSSTVYYYFDRWTDDGTLARLHHELYVRCRGKMGRAASPTACVIDSQSVKSAEKGGPASIHRATARARKSKAKNGTSWPARQVYYCMPPFTAPAFKIATVACWCLKPCPACCHACENSLPMVVIKGRSSSRRWPEF